MEKVLNAINRSKVDRAIEKSEIFDWYKNTDLKALRQKFGYEAGLHLAKAINMDCGTLNRIENKKFNKINNSIIRLYDFYHNDFNIRIDKPTKTKHKSSYSGKSKKIFDWYKNTNLTKLREEFGYLTQTELAKKLNSNTSVISRIETKQRKSLNKNIIRLYNFYSDDSNRKKEIIPEENKKLSKNDESKILNWYLETDLKSLRGKNTQKQQAKKIGIPQSSLWEFEEHKHKKICKNLIKIYNYYNKESLCEDKVASKTYVYDENKVYNWYLSIEDLKDYRRKFGYSLNKMMAMLNLSYDQIRDFESHKYKSATPIVYKFYEFYNNEDNRLPEIKLEDYNNPKFKNYNKKEEKVAVIPFEYLQKVFENDDTENLKKQLEEKDKKIAKLERQIMLYEKLIERLQ